MKTTTAIILLAILFGLVLCLVALAPRTKRGESQPVASKRETLAGTPTFKPRLPAPPVAAATNAEPAAGPGSVPDWLRDLLNGEWPRKLTEQDLRAYLEDNRRNGEALVAAAHLTGDQAFLEEAARTYTNHPSVAFAAFFQAKTPDERRRWVEVLKYRNPDSALGFYLSAREYFNAGQPDKAIDDLMAASTRPLWQDYAADFMLNAEEACLAAGFSETQAKAVSTLGLPLPQLAQLRDLGKQIGELAARYRAAGDEDSAHTALQIGLGLAQRLGRGSGQDSLIQDLVAISTEKSLLGSVDPSTPYDASGRTVQDRLEELNRQRDAIKALGKPSEAAFKNISEQDLSLYIERWRMSGERAAIQWLLNRTAAR